MSKTKAVRVADRVAWAWDNSHDVVLAHLVEVAADAGCLNESFLHDWRVWSSVADLGSIIRRQRALASTR